MTSYVPGGFEPRREPLGQPAYVPPPPSWPQPVATVPPKKRSRLGLILALVGAGLVVLVGVGVVGAALQAKPTAHIQAGATVTASAAATPSPTPVKPTVSTITEQMRAWFDQGGHDRLTALSNAMDAVSKAAQAGDFAGLKAAALQLGVATKSAQEYRSMPDAICQQYWATALNDFSDAARNLYVGATTVDTDILSKATAEEDAGGAQLHLATSRVAQLLGT